MQVLTIRHLAARGKRTARVEVSYQQQENAEPTRTASRPFTFELTDDQQHDLQWYLEEYLSCPWEEFRERARRVEAMLPSLGEALFGATFSSREAQRAYDGVADALGNTRVVVRADSPEGFALPWELLRDPVRGAFGELGSQAGAFVRSQPEVQLKAPNPPAGETLNILMVISRPGGPRQDVPFQSVARQLLELFRPYRERIDLDVLRPPTFEELTRVLGERPNHYHVLHFDGHGRAATVMGGGPARYFAGEQQVRDGVLLFEPEQPDGESRPVTGTELGQLLTGAGIPAVLLNACQSGMPRPDLAFGSVASQLLRAGTAGVVAMSYSVLVESAARFMASLYDRLLKGEGLSTAVGAGRSALRSHPDRRSAIGPLPLQDWLVPVLYETLPVQVSPRLQGSIHLSIDNLADQQARAGAEVGCPEPPDYGFIGRDDELLELERAFRSESLVLLRGMAGTGKTQTAVGFARWLAESGGLEGPIFFTSFEQRRVLDDVVNQVGSVFNPIVKKQLSRDWHVLDVDERRAVALQLLRAVPCLLIWDNLEDVAGFPPGTPSRWSEEEQAELAHFLSDLRGGQTKVVLTSRREEAWVPPHQTIEVGGLTLGQAEELALKVLERARLNLAEITALKDYRPLLRYLQGSPLAIQVILPELRRQAPDALLAALRSGEARLEDDEAQGRQASLGASLRYRLGSAPTEMLTALSVVGLFQGFVDADVLAMMSQPNDAPSAIRDKDEVAWDQVLTFGCEAGLLQRVGNGLYMVHPAVPWYFRDLLARFNTEERQALERYYRGAYAAYAQWLEERFRTHAEQAMALLRAEDGNLHHALRGALGAHDWETVGAVLSGLNRLCLIAGRAVEWGRLLEQVEQALDEDDATAEAEGLRTMLLNYRAQRYLDRRQLIESARTYEALLAHYEATGNERNQAVMLHQLGLVAQEGRHWGQAEGWYHRSLAIKEHLDDERGQAATLHQLGRVAEERRHWDEAEGFFRRSLAIAERLRDEHYQAVILHQLGTVAQEHRQWDEAEGWYRRSLDIKERLGDERSQGGTLHQLGMVAQERGQTDEAEGWYRRSLATQERLGDELGQASTLHQLGILAEEHGKWDEAEGWFHHSLSIGERLGVEPFQATNLHHMGIVAQGRRQWGEAEGLLRRSLAITERLADEHGQAMTLGQLGVLSAIQGHTDVAVRLLEQASSLFERTNDPYAVEQCRRNIQMAKDSVSEDSADTP